MAEPARNYNPQQQPTRNVYDQDVDSTKPNLRALEGEDNGDGIPKGQLKTVPNDESKSKTPEQLSNAEQSAGASIADNSESSPSDQIGKGFTPETPSSDGGIKSVFWGTKTRKRTTIGGLITGLLIGGGIGTLTFFSGPLEFIHIAQLLEQFHFSSQQDAEDNRLFKLARWVRDPSKPQDTRLGIVGSAVSKNLESTLSEKTGLDPVFDSRGIGNAIGYSVNRDNPNFAGKSADEIKSDLVAKYGVPESSIQISGIAGDETIVLNFQKLGNNFLTNYLSQTKLSRAVLTDAGYSKVSSYVGTRIEAKRFGWAFHPIKQIDAKILDAAIKGGQKSLDKLKQQFFQDEATYETNGATAADSVTGKDESPKDKNGNPVNSEAGDTADQVTQIGQDASTTPDRTKLSDKLSTKAKIGGAAGLAALLCVGKGLEGEINTAKFTKAILPMARKAGEAISLGSQVQTGQDINTTQLGFDKSFLDTTDSSGNVTSTWDQAQSIQAELGEPQTGPDIPQSGQVFGSNPLSFLDGIPLLNQVCSILSSPFGFAVNILTAPAGFLVSSAVVPAVTNLAANWLTGAPVDPQASGADYGNYINYGARIAANDQYASAGGVPLSSNDEVALKDTSNSLDSTAFKSQGLAYRIFNVKDAHSLISHLIDNQSPNLSQNFNHIATSIFSIFGALLRIPATLFSGVTHAASQPYDYHGLAAVGFTTSDLTNPLFDNPYDNACYVVGNCTLADGAQISASQGILGGPNGQDYISRVASCFSDTISFDGSVWNINFGGGAPDIYTSYPSGCSDTSNDWKRVRFWLIDTQTIEGFDCYAGTDATANQSCADVGF